MIFGPGELVLVKAGGGRATAVVLLQSIDDRGRLKGWRWVAKSKAWTQSPGRVDELDILGPVSCNDVRRGPAQRSVSKDMREQILWTARRTA